MVNGIDDLAVTNLDGLDTVASLKICVAYQFGDTRLEYMPNDVDTLTKCVPIYEEFPGWLTPTTSARKWKELPEKARTYLKALAAHTGTKLSIVSIGAAREETIFI